MAGKTLWNSVAGEEKTPFDDLKINPMSKKEVEAFMRDYFQKQKDCKHEGTQRWGPSYTMNSLGGWIEHDGYFCHDCGLSSREPIGKYTKVSEREARDNPLNF